MSDELRQCIRSGRGLAPELRWMFQAESGLVDLALARESGDVFLVDETGIAYCLDRRGDVREVNRELEGVRQICWSDTGAWGYALQHSVGLCRLNRGLQIEWRLELTETGLGIACDPYGHHVAVGLANAFNAVFNSRQKQIALFETMRPLRFLRFVMQKPGLYGAAEYGLLCRHDLDGTERWNTKLWSNVGDLTISGDGRRVMLAGFNYGVQCFDRSGSSRSTFVVEGTVHRVSTSVAAERIVAGTMERHLYWLDSDGAMLWAANLPTDVVAVACDPFGEWLICGLDDGYVFCLDWSGG